MLENVNTNAGNEKGKMTADELQQIIEKRSGNQEFDSEIYVKVISGNIKIGDPQNGLLRKIEDLKFVECEFVDSVIVKGQSAGKVIFKDCLFYGLADFDYDQVGFEGRCIFSINVNFFLSRNQLEAKISNLIVKRRLIIRGTVGTLNIEKINEGEEISNQELIVKVQCKDLFLNLLVCDRLDVSQGVQVERGFSLKNLSVKHLIFESITLNGGMNINHSNIENLTCTHLNGSKRHLTILDSKIEIAIFKIDTITNLTIFGPCVNYLELSGSNEKDSIINIEIKSIKELVFADLHNNGSIELRELRTVADGKVFFRSCTFGRTDFINCNFSAGILEFENCKINEAFFSHTEFPEKVFVQEKENHGQAQLVFGQLASAFQKQGDNIRALEYASRELEAHYKTLKWFSPYFFQKLNLWLNFISNNFGRSWVLGGIFSFCVGLIFFCLLLISTDEYKWGLPRIDFDLLPAYLKFMNPLRFYELEALFNNTPLERNIKLNGLSYLADFGGRIFIAYGYYQTIQAFRRFGRK